MNTNTTGNLASDAHIESPQPNYPLMVQMLNDVSLSDIYAGDTTLTPDLTDRMVNMAYTVAVNAHRGVHRKNGEPYINHPLRVANMLKDYEAETIAIALLHDVVEDTEVTITDLEVLFPSEVCEGVGALTHGDDEEYASAIERVCSGSHDAQIVKLADTLDNSSPSQLECFDDVKRQRKQEKYEKARKTILSVIDRQNPLRDRLKGELLVRGEV